MGTKTNATRPTFPPAQRRASSSDELLRLDRDVLELGIKHLRVRSALRAGEDPSECIIHAS
ncbi:hypothetical protein [Pendulispora albinea]|uniref:Uncharacterized protein n=1 Tax=Pendulispora albinea TaxID=2741071 RepID=A0ABZ2LZI4_9BACT